MSLKRAGIAQLKLHPGKAPHWLVKRMMPMANLYYYALSISDLNLKAKHFI
jgi:hypothetical protein